jgi:hypothetical protein
MNVVDSTRTPTGEIGKGGVWLRHIRQFGPIAIAKDSTMTTRRR